MTAVASKGKGQICTNFGFYKCGSIYDRGFEPNAVTFRQFGQISANIANKRFSTGSGVSSSTSSENTKTAAEQREDRKKYYQGKAIEIDSELLSYESAHRTNR